MNIEIKLNNTYMILRSLAIALLLWTSVGSAAAQSTSPEKSIENAVQTLLDEFTARRAELESDKPALYEMVDRLTRPHFDFNKISKLILAKNWKNADAKQREAFTNEFRTLLIRTYATALFQYTGKESMAFEPSKIKERKGVKSATVVSEVRLSDGPGIPVIYSMILGDDELWKIYNLKIAGVNMVTNYRKTYGASIRNLGMDGLIESMREANARI
ncbi:MAG: ABC transporter substrate-binding protein [Acidiferrobacterales bacterium]|nr:ABC transporter substrate-binding protein [Acidiferrobacterales bacterium]